MKKFLLPAAAAVILAACGAENNNENENENENGADNTSGSEAEDGEVFEVAVIPSQSIGEMQEGLDRLEEHLADSLEMDVEVEHYPGYNAVVEAINFGHVDLAYFGPVTYLIAQESSGAEAVLTQTVDGDPYYHSYILTQPDAPWEDLDELLEEVEDVSFAYGSQSSTSGFTIPAYELYDRGVYESESTYEFDSVQFTGSHDITANAIASGDVDAGAIDSAIFQALIEAGDIEEDDFKLLWESEQLYQYPWAVPEGTSEERINDVQDAFTSIEDDEILSIFGGADAFIEISPDEYDNVMEAARHFDMLDPETLEDDDDEEEDNEENNNEDDA
ncbi:phosphate/phosphite/phosphonate ABC transporter substrate-binding protein [Alkalicoccus chagannorensis]|uniref:phosphate/phosphite/phosphonate ABC transporter substrate-binding protein n=1 Tax=Alkalicoccus chagannorensis TaxID=427072 RepID=UPI000401401F|nr:phosphate/phosphite/phosphonate ABC transporter substrate-binding protein [Alkalicoccus chagannorensis]